MVKVVGVMFKDCGRVYYFNSNNLDLKEKDSVIVETERGLQYGVVVTSILEKDKSKLKLSLKNVIRKANKDDEEQNISNIKESKKAFAECEKLIKKYNLNMKLIDSSFTFEREQLIFHFLSESRVDFRSLAKSLASIFKTRIELRQVGVRDKAKEIGGLGPCGRPLCCSSYLDNFDSISINMAKNQNLSLNPNKINGSCGRLLCCLAYENELYEDYKKDLPNIGEKVKYKGKEGRVTDLNILKKSYTFYTKDNEYITVDVIQDK